MEVINQSSIAEHSYPLQLFMQNGIIAFLTYILLLIWIFIKSYKIIKEDKKDVMKFSVLMSLLLIIVHSILDFDMYFQIILIDMYMFLSILNDDKTVQIKHQKVARAICGIVLLILLYFNIGEAISVNLNISKIKDRTTKLRVIDSQILLFPYNYQFYNEKIKLLNEIRDRGIMVDGINIDEEIEKCSKFLKNVEKIRY